MGAGTVDALTVERVGLERLREDPENANVHDDASVEAIARSLERFGQRKPVVALPDGTVVAGNGTLRAAHLLGWDGLAVAWWPTDDRDEAAAYALADNGTARLARWDGALLAGQLERLDGAGWGDDLRVMGLPVGAPGSADVAPDPGEDAYVQQYAVTVVCADEEEQEALYNRLAGEGLDCRVVTV